MNWNQKRLRQPGMCFSVEKKLIHIYSRKVVKKDRVNFFFLNIK